MQHPARTPAARDANREEFPDGSALVTYADGGILIVETDLSREAVLQDSRSVDYNDPPPCACLHTRPMHAEQRLASEVARIVAAR